MRDQIIEGLIDADTIEQLLKESGLDLGLDLEKTISTCRAQEAAKKQRVEITSTSIREPVDVYAVRRQGQSQRPARLCPGCQGNVTSYMTVAVRIAQHSTSPATHARRLVILPECAGEERHNQLPDHHPTYQKHGQSL